MDLNLDNHFEFPLEVIFSKKRKSISIQVHEKIIIVRSTLWASKKDLKSFILKHQNWINKKILEQKSKIKIQYNFINNETFFLMGKAFNLKLDKSLNNSPYILNNFIIASNNKATTKKFGTVKEQLEYLFKEIAYNHLYERTQYYSKLIFVYPKLISIKNYKSRWGSCSSKGEIYYNWKIIMAPDKIIDYLIVHELCHMIHFNHSKQFWSKVQEYITDYKDRRLWLKNNSYKLSL